MRTMDGDHHHLRARHLFFFRGAAGDVTHERVVRCLHQPPMASQDRALSLSKPKSRQNLTFWTCTEPTRGVCGLVINLQESRPVGMVGSAWIKIKRRGEKRTHFVPPFLSRPRRRRDRPARAETMDALRLAAEAGDAGAMSDLGATYTLGSEGLPQDDAEAFQWFRKAAEQGFEEAQRFLDRMGVKYLKSTDQQ